MATSNMRSRKVWIITAVSVLLIAGGTWAVLAWSRPEADPHGVPPELTVASLEKKVQSPEKMAETVQEAFRRDDLTEEQRRQAFRNMRQVWESELDKRIDEYFAAATPEEKNAVLDRHIDEFRANMEVWQRYRREREEERRKREQEQASAGDNANANEADDSRRRHWRERFRTREGRKEAVERRDPDRVARRMAYFGAMRARMQDRGIDMRWSGGHRRSSGR